MKNKNGFTLVELLATLIILALLMGLSIPAITKLIGDNKTKAYINDAKKLVARAETVVNSNNTVIEKPDPDDCIVFSLGYLDDGSFDSSPYRDKEGEYMPDASFVVMKNNGGVYEYSVILVEKYNGSSYRGVKMSTFNQLSESGYKSRVDNINKSLYGEDDYINEFTIDDLDVGKLNSFYKEDEDDEDYISNGGYIVDLYRYEDESTSTSGGYQKLKTKISDIKIISYKKEENGNTKDYLDVTSTIAAGSLNNIWVCTVVSNSDSYDKNLTYNTCSTSGGVIREVIGTSKKSDKVEVKGIDVTDLKNNDLWVLVYVGKAYDNDGDYKSKANIIRQKRKYKLGVDLPPVIEKFDINDEYLYLNVSDDIDKKGDLEICIDNIEADHDECDGTYDKYDDLGFDNNRIKHGYTDSRRNVHVFVKDSGGNKTQKNIVFMKNTPPTIKRFKINPSLISSKNEYGATYRGNSLEVYLDLEVEDDYSNSDNIKVYYVPCDDRFDNDSRSYSNFMRDNLYKFFGKEYDGSKKDMTVCVCDEKDSKDYQSCDSKSDSYNLYSQPSLVGSFDIVSDDEYNSKNVKIKLSSDFDIKAEVDDKDNILIKYCQKNITLNREYPCVSMRYGEFKNKFKGADPYFLLNDADYTYGENTNRNYSMQYQIILKTNDPVNNKDDIVLGSKDYYLYKRCKDKKTINSYQLQDYYYAYSSTGQLNQAITAERCNGNCYDGYSSSIKSYYMKFKTEYDKYLKDENNNDYVCVQTTQVGESAEAYGCGFYTCIGNSNEVKTNVVGNKLIQLDENKWWTEEYTNGKGETKTYTCKSYYRLYRVRVYEDHAVAQPYDGCHIGMCASIFDNNRDDFKYSNKSKTPYYQVDDTTPGGEFITIDDNKVIVDNQC